MDFGNFKKDYIRKMELIPLDSKTILYLLSRLLGHASVKTTESHYLHLIRKMREKTPSHIQEMRIAV